MPQLDSAFAPSRSQAVALSKAVHESVLVQARTYSCPSFGIAHSTSAKCTLIFLKISVLMQKRLIVKIQK